MTFECENCGHEQPSKACSDCRESVPVWAKFCPHCGKEQKKSLRKADKSADPFAMENRRLCPDGNCIGILDADGVCIVCGKSE